MLPAAQSQAASFTATHGVKSVLNRCLYELVPDADKRERDEVRRVGEPISLHTRQYSHSLQIPKYYRYFILIFPRVPRLVPGTVYKDLQGYSTCPSHVIIFRSTPSGNPTIPRRMILRDHRCSYFVRSDKLYRTPSLALDQLTSMQQRWQLPKEIYDGKLISPTKNHSVPQKNSPDQSPWRDCPHADPPS